LEWALVENAMRVDVHPYEEAEGLRFILHLIGLIREKVARSSIRKTTALRFDRGVRARRLVETFVFIVVGMAAK